MNFLEKIENESKSGKLTFLRGYGFDKGETCGYGCCKGYYQGFYSDGKTFYNRLTVYIKDGKVKAVVHKEYDCGGECGTKKKSVSSRDVSERDILELINSILPDNLD